MYKHTFTHTYKTHMYAHTHIYIYIHISHVCSHVDHPNINTLYLCQAVLVKCLNDVCSNISSVTFTNINMYQSGFICGDSTTNQLVSNYHDVCTAVENQRDI